MRERARSDPRHREAPGLEPRGHGNPIHPGRLPGDRLNPAGVQPGRHRLEVRGKRLERPHRLGGAVRWHTGPARLATDSQPGRVRVATGARVRAWAARAAETPGQASIATGPPGMQTRSGHRERSGATGSSLAPSDATSQHITPDQNQARQRAVLHTSLCTVFACLKAGHQSPSGHPRFCPQAYRVAVWNSRHNFLAHRHFW